MHLGFLHLLFNLLALAPLLERFESEFGTLVTLALFTGRKAPERKDTESVELRLTGRSFRDITWRNLHAVGEVCAEE